MLKIIEKSFDLYLLNEKEGENIVECILHSYELFGEVEKNDEYVGHVLITIGKRKPFDFAIWKGDYEPGGNWTNHYVCLPTMLEENEDDELEIIPLGDLGVCVAMEQNHATSISGHYSHTKKEGSSIQKTFLLKMHVCLIY
ncbi:hypothetical protein, partial [Bacillus sp. VKPM B-3276]